MKLQGQMKKRGWRSLLKTLTVDTKVVDVALRLNDWDNSDYFNTESHPHHFTPLVCPLAASWRRWNKQWEREFLHQRQDIWRRQTFGWPHQPLWIYVCACFSWTPECINIFMKTVKRWAVSICFLSEADGLFTMKALWRPTSHPLCKSMLLHKT